MLPVWRVFDSVEEAAAEKYRVNALLLQHAKQPSPHPGSVQRYVSEGGDVMAFGTTPAALRQSVLHILVSRGCVPCVREALRTILPVDLTSADETGRTPAHRLCERVFEADAAAVLELFLKRSLQHPLYDPDGVAHPLRHQPEQPGTCGLQSNAWWIPWSMEDRGIDWKSKKPLGCDFVSYAAALGILSAVWPLLRTVPHYIRLLPSHSTDTNMIPITPGNCYFKAPVRTNRPPSATAGNATPLRIPITTVMWDFDWERLQKIGEDQYFQRNDLRLWHEPRSTAALVRLTCATAIDEPTEVAGLVRDGANLNFEVRFRGETILHTIVSKGTLPCVVAAVRHTTRTLDYTLRDANGKTPLHLLCERHDRDEARQMLVCITQRHEKATVEVRDSVDLFSGPERGGLTLDFFTYAAIHQKLSLFWPVVRWLAVENIREARAKALGDAAAVAKTKTQRKEMEAQAPQSGRIRLSHRVHRWDWDALPEEDRNEFFDNPFGK